MADSIAISIAAKLAEYTVKPIGRWLCYSCHYNSNRENLKKQKEKLQDARERVQHSVDAALRNEEEIYPVVSKWLTDVDRITELATTKLREIEEAGMGSSNAACLNLKQRHQLSREAKKMVGDIAELHNNRNFEKVSHPTLPSEEMDYNSNMENLKNQKEKLQLARERVQNSVDAASRNGEKIYSDVSKWLIDVDRITELATKRLREIEEEAGTGSSNAACQNSEHRHQLSREAKKMVGDIAELFAELHNNGNFEKVSNPALPSEEMDYNSNMENLKNQKEKLQNARERVQHSVDAAFKNGEKIYSDVSKWLIDVDRITELATKRLRESEEEAGTGSSNAACQNSEHRHQLSREAKKMVGDIAELFAEFHKNGIFEKVSYRIPPSEGTDMDYMAMESRMTAVKGIMEALGNADIDKIGVWGMPGVGKSTLMKEIARKATEEKLFNEVVMTVVTNSPDVRRIQGEIADTLGLKFEQETEKGRAIHLQRTLSKDKKILVILDDIWKAVDLHKIGIPSKGCKVVMTSRDRDVLISGMGTQKAIHELKILQKEESWNLFEKMAGDSFKDRPEVRGIATKIVEKCGGLPIALATVSKALRNKRLGGWQDALVRLTRPTPEHDTKFWSPIYSCIQLSYEHLDGEEAVKSLFLLCAGQGYYISYQDLLRYGFGLGLFLNIYTLEEARNRLESLVSNLLDSCLLLQSPHSSKEFYMHDLVRDVATIIASSKNHNMFVMRDDGGQKAWPDVEALNRCEALSIHGGDINKHPNKMECPKLRFFHVDCKDSRNLKISDIFFQGMDKLGVLSLRCMQLSSLFPLTNLQTLCLDRCGLGDIHWIGELKTLVILSLADSDISNLPREIESLTCLRLLDLSNCFELRVIPPNVLSSLVNLEELYMQTTKVQWEVEGPSNEGKNASLAELKRLSHLTTLKIDIRNANNLPATLFHEKLERYKICIGDIIWDPVFMREDAFSRVLKLNLNMSFQLDVGIKMLLKRTEYLYLDEENSTKSVLYELHREDFQQLKYFHIQNNGNIKHILESGTSVVGFPILETFVLNNMFSLEEICQDKLPLSSFKNLKVLKVEDCKKLKFIFSSSIARGLSLLGELNITRCNNMRAIFVKEEEDGIEDQGDMMLFGRLQTLVLNDLPKLVGFLSTKDSFMPDCRETNSEDNHDLQLPLLRHDQVSLPSLQTLRMEGLPKIKHVWSCGQEPKTVFTGLEQLKILEISNCGVEEIVAVEGGGEVVAIRTLEFPRVTNMNFRNLRRLKWFCKGVYVSEWPMLKEMTIQGCHKVEIFASEVVSFEKAVEDQRQSEMSNIKQPLFMVDEHSFPSLEKLLISNMDSLEIIFGKLEGQNGKEPQDLISPASGTEESGATTQFASTGKLPLIYFKNLKVLKVENCQKLRFVSSSSVAKVLSLLEKLKIKRCNNMGAIVVAEDGDVILFHQLQTLVLEDLPQLVSFLSTKSSFRTDCGQIFAEGNHDLHMPLLHHQGKLPLIYFKNLKVLEVENYQKLRFLFSSSIVRGLSLLENLKIKGCNNMGAIVVAEDKDGIEDGDVILFHQLQTLVLEDLPQLVSFLSTKSSFMTDCGQIFAEGNHDLHMPLLHHQVSFPSLQTLLMKDLPKIKHVWSCGQEPKTVLTGLEQLQVLEIEDCWLEEIVAIERGGEAVAIRTLVFPRVTQLKLRNLPRLKWFYKGVHVSKWPMLKEMKIEKCYKVEIFASEVVSFEKAVKDQRQSEMSIKQPLFLVDELSFPSLKKLWIWSVAKLEIVWQDQVTATSFPNIPNANNLLANLLFEKLERYKICIGIQRDHPWDFMREDAFLRVLKLNLNMSFRLDVRIKMLLKRTEYLYLEGNSTKSVLYELHREDFQQLKYFHIQNNGNIKHILESGTSVVAFPILQTFVLNNMFSLEEICQDKLPLSSFKNLKVLKVEYCKKLKFIFSSSIARGLSLLEELNITRCDNLGAIFVKEEEDGIQDQGDMMLFGRLQTLVLKHLPKLVGFLSAKDSLMADCSETNSEDNHDLQLPLLRHDQVSLPSLQTLRMEDLPKIKHVWSCGQEPKTVFTGLEQLKILEISNCEVEEIVAVEGGGEVVAIRTLEFPRVTNMNFRNLRRLKWFCKGVYVSEWPMLKEMTIQGCHKVEIFASEVVSFEKAVEDQRQSEMSNIKQPLFLVDEHSFPSLKTLEFWNMDSLEIIFGKLEGQNGKEPQVLISPALGTEESGATTQFASTGKLPLIYFKNLKVLKVENCQKLRFVSSSSVAKVLSLLKKLKIKRCNNMGAIVVAEDKDGIEDGDVILFHQLQTLELEDLPELVSFFSTKSSFMTDCGQIITEGNHNLHMPLLPHQVSFPSLQTLRMKDLPKIKHVWSYDQEPRTDFRLQNLQEICAKRCESLKSLFPTSVVRCLEQLQVIEIEDCGVEEIVAVEKGGGEAVAIRTLVFPQVIELKFINLLRLKWFYKGVHVTKWPMLKEMKIERCEEVEIFASEVVSFEKTVQDQRQSELSIKQPLFSVDEHSFLSLEILEISKMDSLEIIFGKLEGQNGKNVVPSSVSLHNLTELKISDCHRLINLLTSSTAKTLVQLETITVIDCKRITEIVAMEDIGEANVAITFNKLRCLELRGLPNLTHFCSGPYSFGFPSLDEVIVRCCPEMKTFSHGVLSTPKLTEVYDDMNLHWKDDLNTTIRCLWEESNQYDTR